MTIPTCYKTEFPIGSNVEVIGPCCHHGDRGVVKNYGKSGEETEEMVRVAFSDSSEEWLAPSHLVRVINCPDCGTQMTPGFCPRCALAMGVAYSTQALTILQARCQHTGHDGKEEKFCTICGQAKS